VLRRTKKIVPPVEESTQDQSAKAPTEPPRSKAATVGPIDLSSVDPEKIKIAEEIGIPIKQLIAWTASVEQRFNIIQQNLAEAPQKVVDKLKEESEKARAEYIRRMQESGAAPGQPTGASGQGAGLGLREILKILGPLGGETNPVQERMMNAMFEKTMMGIDLSNALTKAMIIKLAPELATELTKAIVPKSG